MNGGARRLGDLLKDKNIVLRGSDAATRGGFTQVPNFILRSPTIAPGDKLAFAAILSYAWNHNFCFPGQETLARDLGLTERSVRRHLKSLERAGLLTIKRRGLGRTNIYELELNPKGFGTATDRTKMSGPDRTRSSATYRPKVTGTL